MPPISLLPYRVLCWLVPAVLLVVGGLPVPVAAQSAAACAQEVTVESGDTLSTIAGRTLGNQQAYQRIVDATNAAAAQDPSFARITNVNVIAVGWKLCIPGATSSGSLLSVSPATLSTSPVSTAAETALAAPAATEAGQPQALPVLQLGVDELLELSDIAVSINAVLEAQPGPDGLHPLTIAYLRRRSYPGSALAVEQTLTPGDNYTRSLVSYRSEGLKINALLTIPTGPKPPTGWPVVIFNHGYIPPALYQPTERYEAYVDAFARNGYMVLRPDLRGHGASEGMARGAYGDPGYAIDVLNALASIRQHPDADPDRIGMWGHSMGGYLTLRAMVVSGDIRAGVVWSGVVASYTDMLDLWTSQTRYLPEQAQRWHNALVTLYGTPESNPGFWNTISANNYLADLSGPVQLHHGSADPVVPQHFSDLLYQEVLEAGKPIEYYTYAGDDHNITGYFELAMARSLAFMDRYVKGQ